MNVAIATYAVDEILDIRTGIRIERDGGPALWIRSFFDKNNIPLNVHTAEVSAVVSIKVTDNGETGSFLSVPPIMPLTEQSKTADIIMVSTIAQEYDLHDLGAAKGICALDVQGYVRSGYFEKPYDEIKFTCEIFDIVKMTESELNNIPDLIVGEFKQKICLVTRGAEGFSLFERGNETVFTASKINANNTIGAGDTFFAAFCHEYCITKNSVHAAQYAKIQVENFLMSK